MPILRLGAGWYLLALLHSHRHHSQARSWEKNRYNDLAWQSRRSKPCRGEQVVVLRLLVVVVNLLAGALSQQYLAVFVVCLGLGSWAH